jgi:hypothetical protein
MSKRSNTIAAAVLAAGLVAGTAATASAHVVGSPTPAPSQQQQDYQRHKDHVRPTPWQFDLQQSQIGAVSVNDVEATNPLPAVGWTDDQLNPFVDRFHDATGDSVTLRHTSIASANINVNLPTCTVTLDQIGRFSIIADTGTDAGFRSVPGSGTFDLNAMFSWNLVRGHCPLVRVSPRSILRELTLGGHRLPAPSFNDVNVQGEALVFKVTPPIHIFTPTASPSETVSA